MTPALDAAATLVADVGDAVSATSTESEPAVFRQNRAHELAKLVEAIYAGDPEPNAFERWARDVIGEMNAILRSKAVTLLLAGEGSLTVATSAARAADVFDDPSGTSSRPVRLVLHVEPSVKATLTVSFGRESPTPYDRMLLLRAALHLENGLRFRRSRAAKGRVLAEGGEILSEEVAVMAGGRCAEPDELWSALTSGCATLATLSDRRYAVLDTREPALHRSLSAVERDVVTLAARGLPGKALSYELGLPPAAVSRHLGNAAAKVGLPSTFELVRVASLLATNRPPALESAELTAAERDVLALVRAGMSNAAIATARGRSVRTVANQVSSLLRKTGSCSRRTLAARDHQPRDAD